MALTAHPGAQASRAAALAHLRNTLRKAGMEEATIEARILLFEACGIDATALARSPEVEIGAQAAARLAEWLERRLSREPVWRILGTREFWGLPFMLSPQTLVPRPDTEALVEMALRLADGIAPPRRILDLGTGSGCILIALLHELPDACGVGVDRSVEAAQTARANAAMNHVGDRCRFLVGDWAAALAGSFDLIVSNPPYIRSDDIAGLSPEVRVHDPRSALDGGAAGLDPYAVIFEQAAGLLAPGGIVLVEFGAGQGDDVVRIAGASGRPFVCIDRVRDLGDVERAAAFALQSPSATPPLTRKQVF
jgi:release factor glutamine methyltransferase